MDTELDKINDLLKYCEKADDISLQAGLGGVALFQAVYSIIYKDSGYESLFEESLSRMLKTLSKEVNVPSTFCNGIAGFGWLLIYLEEINLIEDNSNEFYADFDFYLEDALNRFVLEKNWDMLHGGLGVAFYFFKRKKYDHVNNFIDFLYNEAIQENNEIKWMRYDPYLKSNIYDFGLAHGNASILNFLGLCYNHNIQISKCRYLIDGLVNFYMNNIQCGDSGSFYPNYINCHEYKIGRIESQSRIAWCYGDLSILYIMYKTSLIIGDHFMQNRILLMLIQTSLRREDSNTKVIDFGVCHGSAGIAFIFADLYEMTNEKSMKNAADYWQEYTLVIFNSNSFENSISIDRKEDKYNLLMGLCGVGLVLLSNKIPFQSKFNVLRNWKEAIFLF